MSDSFRILIALKEISSKLPIGVATKYNIPFMKTRINHYLFFSFILTCCSLSSNEYQTEKKEFEELKLKNLSISSSDMPNKMDIIYHESRDVLKEEFLYGIKSAYFFLKENQKRNSSLNFVSFSDEKDFSCSIIKSNNKKIIYLDEKTNEILRKCDLKNSNNILLINSLKNKIKKNLNFIDPYFSYLEYLFTYESFIDDQDFIVITDKETKAEKTFFLNKESNIEREISMLFEINNSSKRKTDLERITQNRIYLTPRYRKDLKKIVIDTEKIPAERIIAALKFNLVFDPQIYILPRQLDVWRISDKEVFKNLKGFEHPILLQKGFLFDENFESKPLIDKIFYSVGFDSLLFFSRGINRRYIGLLGEYTKNNTQIFIEPEKIGFN